MAIHIGRRKFTATFAGATAAWPLATHAQQGERMRGIGVLMSIAENDPEANSGSPRWNRDPGCSIAGAATTSPSITAGPQAIPTAWKPMVATHRWWYR